MIETVLAVTFVAGLCLLGAALAVAILLWLALWVRVRRANKRGLGPIHSAAADTDEIPMQQPEDEEYTP